MGIGDEYRLKPVETQPVQEYDIGEEGAHAGTRAHIEEFGQLAAEAKHEIDTGAAGSDVLLHLHDTGDYHDALDPIECDYLETVIDTWTRNSQERADQFLRNLHETGRWETNEDLMFAGDAAMQGWLPERDALIHGVGAAYDEFNDPELDLYDTGAARLQRVDSLVRALEEIGPLPT